MPTCYVLANLVKLQTKFKFDKMTLEGLIFFILCWLEYLTMFLICKRYMACIEGSGLISICNNAKFRIHMYIYTQLFNIGSCAFQKSIFSGIRYYAYVFAEHGIGTCHNIESDKISFYVLIECFIFFIWFRNCLFESKHLEYVCLLLVPLSWEKHSIQYRR